MFTAADYDFSEVKTGHELTACCWYEFGRESRAVVQEIESIRAQHSKSQGQQFQINFNSRVSNNVYGVLLTFLSHVGRFPDAAWQTLSQSEKEPMLRMARSLSLLLFYQLTWQNPPLTFSINEPETTTLELWRRQLQERLPTIPKSDIIKSGFFAINLTYDTEVLIEEFKRKLHGLQGKPILEPLSSNMGKAKSAGRQSFRDALNALGAMRLRYFCDTFSVAKKFMQPLKNKPHGMFYERRDGLNRACDAALGHFTKFFGWLDSNPPVHFTPGWKGTQKTKKHF